MVKGEIYKTFTLSQSIQPLLITVAANLVTAIAKSRVVHYRNLIIDHCRPPEMALPHVPITFLGIFSYSIGQASQVDRSRSYGRSIETLFFMALA